MKNYFSKTALAALLLCALGSTSASADTFNDGTLTYSTSGTTATVTGVYKTGTITDLVIPATVTNGGTTYTVTQIAANAFQNNNNLTGSLTINSLVNGSVRYTIGNYAFESCRGITSLALNINKEISEYATLTLGMRAFSNCSNLETVHITGSWNTIGERAFAGDSKIKTVVYSGSSLPTDYNQSFRATENDPAYPETAVLYVLPSLVEKAKAQTSWQNFKTIKNIEELIESISFDAEKYYFNNNEYTKTDGKTYNLYTHLTINSEIDNLLPAITWSQADAGFVGNDALKLGNIKNISKTDSKTTITAGIGNKNASCEIIVGKVAGEDPVDPTPETRYATLLYPRWHALKVPVKNDQIDIDLMVSSRYPINNIMYKDKNVISNFVTSTKIRTLKVDVTGDEDPVLQFTLYYAPTAKNKQDDFGESKDTAVADPLNGSKKDEETPYMVYVKDRTIYVKDRQGNDLDKSVHIHLRSVKDNVKEEFEDKNLLYGNEWYGNFNEITVNDPGMYSVYVGDKLYGKYGEDYFRYIVVVR
ncbi:MAG: leucine-rich repeat protein [Muribaculaceae bacterium]|nr:leucine-rich repeat protein [Muribaculaceae bacterium]